MNNDGCDWIAQRQQILNSLLDSVKQCQIRFGGQAELATEADSRVSCLCASWESALQHGMKHTNRTMSTIKQVTTMAGLNKVTSNIGILDDICTMETEPVYWHYIKHFLNHHEAERYNVMRHVNTDAGRGRAWLRSAFNEHSLERYMHMVIGDEHLVKQYYEDWAFLRDQEKSSMLPNMAAGLDSILFAISIDNSDFNTIRQASGLDLLLGSSAKPSIKCYDEEQPVIQGEPTLAASNKNKEKRRKKKAANIVSFDDPQSGFGSYKSSSSTNSSHRGSNVASSSVTYPTQSSHSMLPGSSRIVATAGTSQVREKTSDCDGSNNKHHKNVPAKIKSQSTGVQSGVGVVTSVNVSDSNSTQLLTTTKSTTAACSSNDRQQQQQGLPRSKSFNWAPTNITAVPKTHHSDVCNVTRDALRGSRNNKSSPHLMQQQSSDSSCISTSSNTQASMSECTSDADDSSNNGGGGIDITVRSAAAGSSLQGSLLEDSYVSATHLNGPCLAKAGVSASSVSRSIPIQAATSRPTSCDTQSSMHSAVSYSGISLAQSALSLDSHITDSPNQSQASISSSEEPNTTRMLVPLSPDGQGDDQLLPIPFSTLDDSVSCESGDIPCYTEDTENAVFALSVAQKGLDNKCGYGLRTDGDGSNAPEPVMYRSQDISVDDLRQAMIAMMNDKEGLQDQLISLDKKLKEEQQKTQNLTLEVELAQATLQDVRNKDDNKMKALARENELLKHQLKKYVGAVQMLRQTSVTTQESADLQGVHIDELQPAIPPGKPLIDYSYEATQFEKKLIQVAEMHGELIEFNEHLQKQLTSREQQVMRLSKELTQLRGPLPNQTDFPEDNISMYSEIDDTHNGQPLIHIWIPSAFLRKTTSGSFHVYQVYIRIRDEEWNIYRRYKDFYQLHKDMKKVYPSVCTVQLPPKKTIGNKEEKFVENRRRLLQNYLRLMINIVIAQNVVLSSAANKQNLIVQVPFFRNQLNEKKKTRATQQQRNGDGSDITYMGL